jgi:hypothetical protein
VVTPPWTWDDKLIPDAVTSPEADIEPTLIVPVTAPLIVTEPVNEISVAVMPIEDEVMVSVELPTVAVMPELLITKV